MNDLLDPDYHQLRLEFFEYVRAIHAEHGFERDPRRLCAALNVRLQGSGANLYTRSMGTPLIHYDPAQPASRLRFTLWHEIAHHLFQTADHGFQALLEERYGRNTEMSRSLEEQVCYEAAAILLMPDQHLEEVIKRHGLDPQAALHLAQVCGASNEAALRRLVDVFDLDTWCLIMQRGGLVVFAHTRTRFGLGNGFTIEGAHPIHLTFEGDGLFERRAQMPFPKRSPRTPHRNMRAVARGERVFAIFADAFPPRHDDQQLGLFL